MLIWLILLIPLAAVLILAIFFTKKVVIWEYILVFGIPCIAVIIGKVASVESQLNTKEIWNSYLVKAAYEEDWDEWHRETCYRTVSCGKNCTTTESYDCSHRVYHPPMWYVYDNIGERFYVTQNYFEDVCKTWGKRTFVNMHRHYYTQNGNAYTSMLDTSFQHIYAVCKTHIYQNRVKCAKSVFNFEDIDSLEKATFKLFDYPKFTDYPNSFVSLKTHDIMTYYPILGINKSDSAGIKLQKYNALYGATKKVHMMILVFNNQPREAANKQEAYWKGGNKNEFILCIGTQGKKITWTRVISWTDKEQLKVRVARKVKDMDTLNLNNVVEYMQDDVKKNFVKKSFHDFDYLTVEPTFAAIIITFFITLVLTIGLCIFVVMDDIDVGGQTNRFKSY